MSDPNFPSNLNISPLHLDEHKQIDTWNQQVNIKKYGIAGRVWEATKPLLEYLTPECTRYTPRCSIYSREAPRRIIELGSGQSLASLHLASKLSSTDLVVLTDLPNVVPLCEESVATWRNSLGDEEETAKVVVKALAWGEDVDLSEFGRWTHILMCDLVYFPNLYPPLLLTLLRLTEPDGPISEDSPTFGPEIIISYKSRTLSLEESFFHSLSHYFALSPITGGDPSVRLYTCQRWRITDSWVLPGLGGVMNGSEGVVRGRDWGLIDELFGELEWEI